MKKSKEKRVATAQPCVAGKQPFRIKFGMKGVLPPAMKRVLRVLQVLFQRKIQQINQIIVKPLKTVKQ